MLRLILGRAGSGKTREIWSRAAAQAAGENARVFLIVPEQMSFESERALLRYIPPEHAPRVQVLNFSRLVSEAGRLYGGFAGRRIDDGGRMIMMTLALQKVSDMLTLYRAFVKSPQFAAAMLSAVSEFKQCALTPADLDAAARKLHGGELQDKIREMSVVMGAYEALVGASYLDAQDDLTRLYHILKTKDFFRDTTILLDGFKGFTAQQMNLISIMLRDADSVTVSLTADGLSEEEAFGLFSNIRQTALRLVRMAKDAGRRAAAPLILPAGGRFVPDSLKALESAFFSPECEPFPGDAPEVTLAQAQTPYDEIELTAREIRRLLREEGYRCREIAVIARDLEPYRGVIESVFPKYRIPYFLDARRRVDTQPLMRCVLAALEAALSGYSSDDIFEYLKTGAAGMNPQELAELENYVFIWSITGPRWLEPFTADPDGFTDKPMDAEKQSRLDAVNLLRAQAVGPLSRLKDALNTASPRRMLYGLYRFLDEIGAADSLRGTARALQEDGELTEAELMRRSWDVLMQCFDQMALTLEDTELNPRGFHQLLETVIAAQDLGAAPPELDEVNIGDAERMRPAAPRAVFVIGAAEGVFPRTAPAGGLLSQTERQRLMDTGLEVSGSAEKNAVDERYLAYSAVCAASERVFISCARAGGSGKPQYPSEIFAQVREILPRCRILHPGAQDGLSALESPAAALEAAARGIRANSPLDTALRRWLEHRAPEQLRRLRLLLRREPAEIRRETAKRLYGEHLGVSASRLETFYKCPFSYFCRYGLRAQPLKRAQMDVLQRGTLSHLVLERMLSRYGADFKTLPRRTLSDGISGILEEYLEMVLGGAQDKSKRFLYNIARIRQMLLELLCQLQFEFSQSEFSPAAFELPIGEGGISPPRLPLPEGGSIAVYGSVDRVDVWKHEGKTYLRVVDYKSGTRKFKLYDVLYGHNLQMLIYLFTVCDSGMFGGEAVPAGVLYLPVKRMLGDAADSGEEADETELAKKFRMSGVVLEEDMVINAMEPGAQGIFIPAKRLKSGALDKRSDTVSARGLSMLHRHVNALLTEMGRRLKAGDAAVAPLDGSKGACQYCEYVSVCKKEPDAVNPSIPKLSAAQVFETLEESVGEGEVSGGI